MILLARPRVVGPKVPIFWASAGQTFQLVQKANRRTPIPREINEVCRGFS